MSLRGALEGSVRYSVRAQSVLRPRRAPRCAATAKICVELRGARKGLPASWIADGVHGFVAHVLMRRWLGSFPGHLIGFSKVVSNGHIVLLVFFVDLDSKVMSEWLLCVLVVLGPFRIGATVSWLREYEGSFRQAMSER